MSDEQTPRSGSRWEPADPPPVTASHSDEAGPTEPRRPWRDRAGGGLGLGLGALALVLVGGLGGAAVAHTVAGDDDGPETSWVRESGLPGADQPGAGQPGLQEPPGPDAGRLPTWDDDADDAGELDDADGPDEHETHADLGEHEGFEAEHAGSDT